MKKMTSLGVGLLITLGIHAQSFDKQKMDSLFSVIADHDKAMGSISIFEKGKEVYKHVTGWVSMEAQVPANNTTKYRIGSVSKIFTSAIIMQLIEQEHLRFDSPLSDYFPGIEHAEQITIEHLLRHQSGIFNFTDAEDYAFWMKQPVTRDEMIARIMSHENIFEPGARTGYSNSNYVLLSYIAEDITGKDYAQMLEDRITKPYELQNTYYGTGIDAENNEARSYTWVQGWKPASETDMSIPAGAGGIVSTPTDMNIFLDRLFSGKVVSPSSLQTMMDIEDGIGMGLFKVPFYNKQAYGHTGGIDGFQSHAFYFPNEQVAVTYLSNGVVMAVNEIVIGVLSIYFGRDYELPVFEEAIELTSEELDKYLGVYASPDFPLDITISKKGNVLMGQATGQVAFPLEAYGQHTFRFEQASLKLEFLPEEERLILRQHGQEFVLGRK